MEVSFMRHTRAALLVVATALAPALLLTAPTTASAHQAAPASARASATPAAATADTSDTPVDDTPVDDMTEAELRAAIAAILADEDSGRGVVREANKALGGSVDDMRTFLKTGYRLAQAEDDRVAVVRILNLAQQNNDARVVADINRLLDNNEPDEIRTWLETGYGPALSDDEGVAVARALYLAQLGQDRRVIKETNQLLDNNSPAEIHAWLESGYRLAQAEDDRVAVVRMLTAPDLSAPLRAAINAVLDDGSAEAVRYFREVGRYKITG
ncbi:ALF repeat-containing protein [Streptomyces sp. NPDC049813]|uniref:ALF repeat-containing protein n=1 Tax=Streptomyces sp. NPDC049813 TaxID=3365597 RepID=UPI0037A7D193